MKPPEWMRHGACVGHDPELFFEKAGETEAKAICKGCPVWLECADYAREERIDWGVWGGLTATERCGRGRPRMPIEHGTYNGYRTHLRRGETACKACLKAAADYQALMKARQKGLPRYVKCAHQFGCDQWALRDGDLCWTHNRSRVDHA